MNETRTVLVLGGTGMLGHELVRVLAGEFDVHATVRRRTASVEAALAVPLHEYDAWSDEGLDGVLDRTRPDVVVNCIGLVKQLREASEPIQAITLNSLLPHQVAESCAARSVRLIHVSTDCVFSGRIPAGARYRESDVPDPVDLYGRSKLLGEIDDSHALTLRTSIIGWELERATGLLEWATAQRGSEVSGFVNAWFSGLTTTALSRVIAVLIEQFPGLVGLYHASAEPISKHDLLVRLNDVLGLELSIVPAEEPRINRSLDSSELRARTNLELPAWDEMLTELSERKVDAVRR
jgi:dTDP-4-dehydrorhamnose reductase